MPYSVCAHCICVSDVAFLTFDVQEDKIKFTKVEDLFARISVVPCTTIDMPSSDIHA